jgi:hypothetical protein
VGWAPRTRREALLYELCSHHGYFGIGLSADELVDGLTAEDIADIVLRREGLNPAIDRRQRQRLIAIVEDWLFDPQGRGASSGLPLSA